VTAIRASKTSNLSPTEIYVVTDAVGPWEEGTRALNFRFLFALCDATVTNELLPSHDPSRVRGSAIHSADGLISSRVPLLLLPSVRQYKSGLVSGASRKSAFFFARSFVINRCPIPVRPHTNRTLRISLTYNPNNPRYVQRKSHNDGDAPT